MRNLETQQLTVMQEAYRDAMLRSRSKNKLESMLRQDKSRFT